MPAPVIAPATKHERRGLEAGPIAEKENALEGTESSGGTRANRSGMTPGAATARTRTGDNALKPVGALHRRHNGRRAIGLERGAYSARGSALKSEPQALRPARAAARSREEQHPRRGETLEG